MTFVLEYYEFNVTLYHLRTISSNLNVSWRTRGWIVKGGEG